MKLNLTKFTIFLQFSANSFRLESAQREAFHREHLVRGETLPVANYSADYLAITALSRDTISFGKKQNGEIRPVVGDSMPIRDATSFQS